MDIEVFWTMCFVFISTTFFAFISWLNFRSKSDKYQDNTTKRTKVEGITHSLSGAMLGVAVFAGLQQFSPEWSLFFKGAISVVSGAFLGEAMLKMAERKLENV